MSMFPAHPGARDNGRLWVSFAASALAHAIALVVLAGLLLPLPAPVWTRIGQPTALEVLVRAAQPAEVAAPPMTVAEVAPPMPVLAPVAPPLPVPKPADPLPEPAAPVLRSESRPTAAAATGAATPTEPTPDAVPDDAPLPPGDTAVGAVSSAESMGKTTTLRLAQRFTERVDKPPQLLSPLLIPYPPQAARARRDARISALLIIDARGTVLETTLTPEDPLFLPTVQSALASAKFRPAEIDGKPAIYWLVLEFVFRIRPVYSPKRAAAG